MIWLPFLLPSRQLAGDSGERLSSSSRPWHPYLPIPFPVVSASRRGLKAGLLTAVSIPNITEGERVGTGSIACRTDNQQTDRQAGSSDDTHDAAEWDRSLLSG